MSGNLRLSRVKFQNVKSREIIRQNEALDLKFAKKYFQAQSRPLKVKNNDKGQKGQISKLRQSSKSIRQMKLLTLYFQKYLVQGHSRSPDIKKHRKRSNFKLYQ